MGTKSRIVALMEELEISQEKLIAHRKAHDSLSRYGNEKALDGIPQRDRYTIGQFYYELRKWGIFDYDPETGKCRKLIDYLDGWVHTLRNQPERPEFQNITREEVDKMLKYHIDIGPKHKGNIKFGLLGGPN